jgi:YD repeat-containing protein
MTNSSIGQLSSVEAVGVSTTNYSSFDALGRPARSTQITNGSGYSLAYTYTASGALDTETYPSGRLVTVKYDKMDRPESVIETVNGQDKSYVSQIAYTPGGQQQSYAFGNGLNRSYTYNSRLQPVQISDNFTGQANPALDLHYVWGTTAATNNGNLSSQTIAVGTTDHFSQAYQYL